NVPSTQIRENEPNPSELRRCRRWDCANRRNEPTGRAYIRQQSMAAWGIPANARPPRPLRVNGPSEARILQLAGSWRSWHHRERAARDEAGKNGSAATIFRGDFVADAASSDGRGRA